ncbi:hypothetical protein PV326_013304, partial [Microctonus aethiopoides]
CIYDTDCDPLEKCSNNKCIYACDGVSCGSEAHCQNYHNHTSSCICGSKLEFDSSLKECGSQNGIVTLTVVCNIGKVGRKQFLMNITAKNIYTQLDAKATNVVFPPNTLSVHEYLGFWLRFNDTTIKIGKMENNTQIRENVIGNDLIINYIHLTSANDTEWFVAGLLPD